MALVVTLVALSLACSPEYTCVKHRLSPLCWRPSSAEYVSYVSFWKKHGHEVCKLNRTMIPRESVIPKERRRYDAVVYVSNEKVSPTCFWNNIWWLSDKNDVQQPPGSVLLIYEQCGNSKLQVEMLRTLQYKITERCDLSIANQIEYMYTANKTMSVGASPLTFAAKAHDLDNLRVLSMGLWWADWWIDC